MYLHTEFHMPSSNIKLVITQIESHIIVLHPNINPPSLHEFLIFLRSI
jgi:hypothetical protein